MTDDRWVVLGLAHPRVAWFSRLARWSTAAAIPVDFIKCVSRDEVLARLNGGRPYSALLIGADVAGLDRDLIDQAHIAGASVIVVGSNVAREWHELGVATKLPEEFERSELLSALSEHAPPIATVTAVVGDPMVHYEPTWRGQLIAVTGPGGAGTSVVAMAVSQSFASEPSNQSMVLLADLALNAEQGMLHDAREVIPGLQEFVDAHRVGRVSMEQMRSLVFEAVGRGYHLLLGLRRHRDWTAIRPRSFETSLQGMLRSYRLVVADINNDFEGERDTGSQDVEDRNHMARTVAMGADLVVVVGVATTKGIHSLTRTVRELIALNVNSDRIVAVFNRSTRNPRRQADAADALATLLARHNETLSIGDPVFFSERTDIEEALRDGVRLPTAAAKSLHRQINNRLVALSRPQQSPELVPMLEAVPVVPGSLGHYNDPS
ncbi:MAG: hypothetical protein OXB90_04690 [Acidimicrobiaceae bacterium]|nr:hypothetical protein [Acidimicrobiaceae bacterium]